MELKGTKNQKKIYWKHLQENLKQEIKYTYFASKAKKRRI